MRKLILTLAIFLLGTVSQSFAAFSAPAAGQACYQAVTAGNTIFCALTSNPTNGNVVVVTFMTFTGMTAGAGSVVDGAGTPNVYSTPVCRTTFDTTAGTVCLSYFIANATADKTITITLTGAGCGACSIRVDEFGVSGGTASLDGTVQTASGATQAITGPTITPGGSGRLLVGMCASGDTCGAVGGSWVAEVNSPGSFAEATEYQLSVGSATAVSFAGTSTANWDAVGAAFQISGGGGSPTPLPRRPRTM